jgi:hypothetical protein
VAKVHARESIKTLQRRIDAFPSSETRSAKSRKVGFERMPSMLLTGANGLHRDADGTGIA